MPEPRSVRPRPRDRYRWLFALSVAIACAGSGTAPLSPSGALTPNPAEAGARAQGPFRVVFSAPSKVAPESAEISIVFDRALVPLDAAGTEPPNIVMTPKVPGRFRWVGTRALVFVPETGRLPAATAFTVEVPAGLRAADGAVLTAPHRFTFETPRPAVVSSTPHDGAGGVVLTTNVALEFNQPVTAKRVEASGALTANGKPVPFSARPADAQSTRKILVEPRGRLPVEADIRFTLPEGFLGEEGPLPADRATSVAFRTYERLRVSNIECNRESPQRRCSPTSSVALSFTNPVRFGDIKRALRLTPEVALRWPAWQEDAASTTYVEIPARLAAGQRYQITVGGAVRDIHGQALGADFHREIVMDDYFPRVAIGVTEGTLVATDRGPIPLAAVNAPGARVRAAALTRDDVVRLAKPGAELTKVVRAHPRAQNILLPPPGAKNTVIHATVDPQAVLGGSGFGALGLLAEYTPDKRDYGAPSRDRLAKISDVGIAAKLSRHGSLVWVTRLSSAEPIAGAEVELARADGQRRRYVTNADGIAEIPAKDYAPNLDWSSPDRQGVLFAASGQDWNYERVEDLMAPWASDVPVDLGATSPVQGLLFTDRGVYRPGDTVRVKGIARRMMPGAITVPKSENVTLTLRGPSGTALRTLETQVSAWGTFDAQVALPAAAELGPHRLVAKLADGEISAPVAVEEYRPAEFQVDVSAKESYVRGDRADFAIRASYLFGAPLANADVRYFVSRGYSSFSPPGHEQFSTNAQAYYTDLDEAALSGGPLANAEAKLDAQGAHAVPQPLALPGQRGAESVTLEAEVTDVARVSAAGRASVVVHPAEFYVGIQVTDGFVPKVPAQVRPNVVALSPAGKRLAGKKLELELVQRRWTFSPATNDEPERYRVIDTVVSRCAVVSAEAPAGCALDVAKAGYHVIRARSRDARGNAVEAAHSLYALGAMDGTFADDPGDLELVLDKKLYRPGERARVLVKSPFPEAEALITVERAGVLHRERRSLRGAMPYFDVEVTERYRPNAFIAVHLIRKMAPAGEERAYRFGYAELKVDPEDKRLNVTVTPSARELGPGDELTVDVSVRDPRGAAQKAEVTLYAVDEGVLMLTGYEVPDPLRVFAGSRPLEVATLESRSKIARRETRGLAGLLFGNKGEEGGGGGDSSVRRDFQQTAYFNPSLVTDANGRARAQFRLPQSLTRYRIMAVVVGEAERFGFASSDVTTSKRLMARPALPRFVRVGDRVDAGVVVSTKRFGPATVVVRARAEGLTLDGPDTQRVDVPADGNREVRFGFRAVTAGRAMLRFDVQSGAERDAVEVERRVMVPAVLEAAALSGSTTGAIAERLGALTAVRPDVGGLEVSLASSALVGLEASMQQLADYPYGCTEQLASRLMPLLVQGRLGTGAKPESASKTAATSTLRELLSRQLGDGGFGFWAEAERSEGWVSAYAVWVLHGAKHRGLDVPVHVLQRGREYLRQYLARPSEQPVDLATAAFMVDVLASVGQPDTGYANRLFEARSQLPTFARALLLSALALGKGDADAIDTLVKELEAAVRVSGATAAVVHNTGDAYAVLMDSEARTHALVLRAFALARPKHPLLPELARGLLALRRGGTWATTQESAFALAALDAYRATTERATPDFEAHAWFGERAIVSARFAGRASDPIARTVPMSELLQHKDQLLRFEREGSGTLFYQARLSYARAELPRAPLDAGFYLEKSLRAIRPEDLESLPDAPMSTSQRRFAGGDLVLGELVVVSSAPQDYVVVDEPLPAGFEAINTALRTTAQRYDLRRSPDACPDCGDERDRVAEGRSVREAQHRRELHDDRVVFLVDYLPPGIHRFRYLARATTLGSFVLPPARVEGMYRPEVFGRTAADTVEVR